MVKMRPPETISAKRHSVSGAEPLNWASFVDAYADELVRLAARVLGNTAEAEDVVQEAWAKSLVALKAEAFKGEASLKTWLFRIVLRVALDSRRTARRREHREQTWEQHRGQGHPEIEASVALRQIAELLDALPPEQAEALVLKEFHGMTAAEVGEVLQCSEGAVEQRLVRARATLKTWVNHE
jgi:RNA polymerase sigma-70 factor, ECF subfamily